MPLATPWPSTCRPALRNDVHLRRRDRLSGLIPRIFSGRMTWMTNSDPRPTSRNTSIGGGDAVRSPRQSAEPFPPSTLSLGIQASQRFRCAVSAALGRVPFGNAEPLIFDSRVQSELGDAATMHELPISRSIARIVAQYVEIARFEQCSMMCSYRGTITAPVAKRASKSSRAIDKSGILRCRSNLALGHAAGQCLWVAWWLPGLTWSVVLFVLLRRRGLDAYCSRACGGGHQVDQAGLCRNDDRLAMTRRRPFTSQCRLR